MESGDPGSMNTDVIAYNRIDPAIEARVAALLGQMTLEEKVGQLVLESPFAPVDWGAVIQQMKQAEESGQPFSIPHELRPEIASLLRGGRPGAIMSADAPTTNR